MEKTCRSAPTTAISTTRRWILDYVSFAGMWVVAENRVGYVEPVATDPTYRRMGLGRAAVLESIRNAGAGGARVAWVGSDQEFYLAMGFNVRNRSRLWIKDLE